MQTYTALITLIQQTASSSYQVTIFPDGYQGDDPPTNYFSSPSDLTAAIGLFGIQGNVLSTMFSDLSKNGLAVFHNLIIEDKHLGYFGWLPSAGAEVKKEFERIG